MTMTAWIIGGFAAAIALWLLITFNQLVARRNKVAEAWSGIDVQLRRRADLVPNLVTTVKGYQVHEQELLTAVAEARARILEASGPREAGQADDGLEGALQRLFAVAESYPQLRASENYLQLQHELAALEEDISFARRYYNALVERLNTTIQRLPTVLVARPMGFTPAEFFKAEATERVAPAVGGSS